MLVRARRAFSVPETYALLIALWYAVMLTLGIPKLPPIGHLLGAVSFLGILAVAVVTAALLDAGGRRRTLAVLALGFVSNALLFSLWTMTAPETPKQIMKSSMAGRVLIGLVGACLFVGVLVAAVAAVDSLRRGRSLLE